MASSTPVFSFRPAVVRACASSGDRRISKDVAASGSGDWWTPLFGWPAGADYIQRPDGGAPGGKSEPERTAPAGNGGKRRSVVFTDEKARRLRMMTAVTSTVHDAMYHSSIAARLASDFSGRSGQ